MKSTYSEKLRDPRWQKKRLEILNRDEFTCRDCGSKTKHLHVHHCHYEKGEPWETNSRFLLTLCEGCHESRGDLEADAKKALGILMSKMENAEDDCRLRLFVEGLLRATEYDDPSVWSHDSVCDLHYRMMKAEAALLKMNQVAQ